MNTIKGRTVNAINAFIEAIKGLTREQLNKELKTRFNVEFVHRRYTPHIGDKQRIKNLKRLGLTEAEAIKRLSASR